MNCCICDRPVGRNGIWAFSWVQWCSASCREETRAAAIMRKAFRRQHRVASLTAAVQAGFGTYGSTYYANKFNAVDALQELALLAMEER
jgi:hypothetical protein